MPALSDYKGGTLTYAQVGERIIGIHQLYKSLHIQKGDKIALIGRNMSNWGIVYLATVTYGAVIVPILPDFSSSDIHHIVNHSGSKVFFATDLLFDKIDEGKMSKLKGIISVNRFDVLVDLNGELTPAVEAVNAKLNGDGSGYDEKIIDFPAIDADDVAVLSYTSGTSGFSKGVLIPHRSIWSNVIFAREHLSLLQGERIVSFLPLAHSYGCLFEFLWPFVQGCHITFLTRSPSPQIIAEAFRAVKPHLILSVPLILEKIFKRRIYPEIEQPKIKTLLKIPGIRKIVHRKIRTKMIEVFGGEFKELVIGGAALNKNVEAFLRKIEFPFTVGYGMTECGPLISYAPHNETITRSAGKIVDRMEVKIDSNDPYKEVGEIMVRGDNTMLGYYKNEKATKEILDNDGWLRTGDLGIINKDNFVFIKGRSKNMILGPSGQNIYPEEIEARIGSMDYVHECLVRDDNGKLEALIYPDYEVVDTEGLNNSQLEEKMQEMKKIINKQLPAYMNIAKITLIAEEFEKTPKRSIKRYIYTK